MKSCASGGVQRLRSPGSRAGRAALLLLLAALCGSLAVLATAGECGGSPAGAWKERVESLHRSGQALWGQQKLRRALDSFRQALDLCEREGELAPSELLRDAGNVAMYLADYSAALSYLLRGLESAESRGQALVATECSYLVGYVHRDQNNYPPARQYFQKALDMAEAAGDARHVILALNELGNVGILDGKYAEALACKQKALSRARSHGDSYVLSACLHDMGVYFTYRGEHTRALPFYREALEIDQRSGGKRDVLISLTNIASCLSSLGRLDEAVAAIDRALATAGEDEFPKDIQMVYLQGAETLEQMGNYRQAYAYLRKYKDLNEVIFSREQTEKIAEMQERFESVKRQKENELLRRENEIKVLALEKQVNLRNFTIIIAMLGLLLAGLVYGRYRDKARANARLEAANRQIHSQKKELENAYGKMEALAREDVLTGLPNRRVALEELEREAQRSRRSGRPLAVLMGDLNGFKAINDRFGHEAGDAVLKTVSSLLRGSLRGQDTLARWGGDEFFLLLPETDRQGALRICAALQEKVAGHNFEFQGQRAAVTLSLGLSLFDPGRTVDDCLKEADREMYRQKKGGA